MPDLAISALLELSCTLTEVEAIADFNYISLFCHPLFLSSVHLKYFDSGK